MAKTLITPLLILFACVLAALFGAVHNQISFAIGPDYFTALKFPQFGIAPDMPDRAGAALVGMRAGWWMGLLIGLPVALICLRAAEAGTMVAVFMGTSAMIVGLTLGLGLLSLLIPITPEIAASVPQPDEVSDPIGFARAAFMHEISYGAGFLGLLIGLVYAWRQTRH